MAQEEQDSILQLNFGEHTYEFKLRKHDGVEIVDEYSYSYHCKFHSFSNKKWKTPISHTEYIQPKASIDIDYFESNVLIEKLDLDSIVLRNVTDIITSSYRDTISLKERIGTSKTILGYKFTAIDFHGDVHQGYQHFSNDRKHYIFDSNGERYEYVIIHQIYYSEPEEQRAYCIRPNLVVAVITDK